MGTAIGKISSSPDGEDIIVEWTIPNFFSLSKKDGAYYWSPKFSFGGEEWYLRISPNGQSKRDSHNHVDLHLYKYSSGISIKQACFLSLKTLKGEKQYEKHGTKVFDGFGERYEFNRFISRSEISNKMSELVPGGDLTVVCKMKKTTSAGSASETSTAECPHCKLTLGAANVLTHEKNCMDRPMKCEQCGEVLARKLWIDHECMTARTNAIEKLLQDLKRLMACGEHSDVTVNVKGQEFRLHRGILGARNPFFSSKFNNESQKTIPVKLSIDDCDPAQFSTLVHYIYTGMADNLCSENVCGLYEVAVAYQEQQMKTECSQFMTNTLSVDNFCDYTALALKHDQEELLQKATELFMRKVKEIIRHNAWKNFLEKYPAQANKLYLKALDQDDEK